MSDSTRPIDRRTVLRAAGGLVAVGASLLAGCSEAGSDDEEPASPTDERDTETPPDQTATPEEETTPPGEGLHFDGEGSHTTDVFEVDGGLVVLEVEYAGTEPFFVEVLDEQGKRVALPVNTVGEWSGTAAFHADAGSYGLRVDGDGDWEITLSQPRPESGDSPSVEMQGSHSAVLGPFESDGDVRLEYRNNGKHVEILLMDTVGDTREVLVQDGGDDVDVTGTFSYDGLYYIFVDTKLVDSWELVLEPAQ